MKEVLKEYKDNKKINFLLFGRGTEKENLSKYIKENKINNAILENYIPSDEYSELLKQADIGLVFLDYRFTIPNIPSRTLSYFES